MPRQKGGFSQRLIFLRLLLAAIFIILIAKEKVMLSAFFFIVAGLLGFIEGIIQKRTPAISRRRKMLDFTADKVLVNAAAITLALKDVVPYWFPAILLARDVMTVAGAAIILKRNQDAELKPTMMGKMALFFQFVALIPAILGYADDILLVLSAAITIISGVEAFLRSEFRPVRRKREAAQFSMVRMIRLPDLFTMGNVACGILSIMFAINDQYGYAAGLMLGAAAFDFFDGKVARWVGQQREFGRELDSLADTISFGVAPAIFAFSLIQTKLAIIAFTIFVFCGILRLARYNITSDRTEGFIGMPITLNGILIPVVYFAGLDAKWYPYLYLILGFLMVSSMKVRKFGA